MDKRTNEAQDSPGWVKVAAGSSSSRPQAEMDTRPRIDDHSISAPGLEDQAITASDSTSRWLALPPEMKMAFYESLGRPKPLTKGLVQRTFTSADGRKFCVTDTKCACPGAGMVVENAVPPKVMRISSTFWDRYDQECHCMLKKSTLHVYIRDKIPKSITDGPWNVKISDEEHLYDEPYDIQQLALKNFITVSGPQNDGDRRFSELLAPLGVNSLMEFCVMSARSGHTSWAWGEIGSERAWKYYIDAPISYQLEFRDRFYANHASPEQKSLMQQFLYDPFIDHCFEEARRPVPSLMPESVRSQFQQDRKFVQELHTWNVQNHCLSKIEHCVVRLAGSAVLGDHVHGIWQDAEHDLFASRDIEELKNGQKTMIGTQTGAILARIDALVLDIRSKLSAEATIRFEFELSGWKFADCDEEQLQWAEERGIREKYEYWFCPDTFVSHMEVQHPQIKFSFFKEVVEGDKNIKAMWTMKAKREGDKWVEGEWHYRGTGQSVSEGTLIPGVEEDICTQLKRLKRPAKGSCTR